MWTFPTIFILWYHTFFRLLLAENGDIKFLQFFAKMKNDREGGGRGGWSRIFPELGKVLGCHMPNFRSLGQSLHIDHFCKNQWVGGEGGGPYYPFGRKSPNLLSISSLIVKIFQSIRKLSYVRKYFSIVKNVCLGPGTAFRIPIFSTRVRVRPITNNLRF